MPGMFAPHEFQFIFFNLPFTLLFIYLLNKNKLSHIISYKYIILYVILCLSEYQFIIPKVHVNNESMHNKIYGMTQIINSSKTSKSKKPLLIINSISLADSLKGNTIILSYLFNSFTYCLDKNYLKKDSLDLNVIEKEVDAFYEKIPSYASSRIDKSQTFIISDIPISTKHDLNPEVPLINKKIKIGGSFVYSVCTVPTSK